MQEFTSYGKNLYSGLIHGFVTAGDRAQNNLLQNRMNLQLNFLRMYMFILL